MRGRYADALLSYLARFPVGPHNRAVAERLEALIAELGPHAPRQASHLQWALRSLREPYMPRLRSDTWAEPKPPSTLVPAPPRDSWPAPASPSQPPSTSASIVPGNPA